MSFFLIIAVTNNYISNLRGALGVKKTGRDAGF